MPWQERVLDVALEHDAHGHLLHRLVCVTVPRQQGKSTLVQAVALFGALRAPRRVVMHTAQTRFDARERWGEGVQALQAGPLAPTIRRIRQTNGEERVAFRNGSLWRVFAPTEEGAHGSTTDVALLDEAWALTERTLQAIVPSTQTRPDPQLWLLSTAGTDDSTMLRRHVEMGRAGADGLCYFEWSAPDDSPPADPETWRACMPALGRTVTEAHVRHAQATLTEGTFARAYLNRWTRVLESVIPAAWWAQCRDPSSELPFDVPLAVGADLSLDRGLVSIAVAGIRPDGRLHVEVVDQVQGTEAAPARILEVAYRAGAQAIAISGEPHAGELVLGLQQAGTEPLTAYGNRYAAACAHIFDAVRQGRLAHRGQPSLDAATAAAGRRILGDSWAWSRRQSAADIGPLVAVTLAAWALDSVPTPGAMFA